MSRSSLTHGSQRLRDLFVCLVALLVAAPVIALLPRLCIALLFGWVALFLTPLPRWLLGRRSGVPEAGVGAIAVLAGGFAADGALSPRSLRRLRHALELAHEKGTALILCGGALCDQRTEAAAMAQEADAAGFQGPIQLEQQSRTTFENILALGKIAEEKPLLVLTCPHHRARVARLSRLLGARLVLVTYSPARIPSGVGADLQLAKECFYELAIHVWLSLRTVLVALGLRPALRSLQRPHLKDPL